MKPPVAVSGLGCRCAAGDTLGACMESLRLGQRHPVPPVRLHTNHPAPFPVFEVLGFEHPPELLRTSALLLAAAREALRDAGLDEGALGDLRVGVCVGTTVGCALSDEPFCRAFREGQDPNLAPLERVLQNNPAGVLARTFGLGGPCQNVVNACSSGTDAIGLGASWIQAGLCDVVLAGGADELSRITLNGFIALKIVDPGPCRPFDLERRGLNLGEGAAVLVLESEASLLRRRGRARGRVLGYGAACDAHHQTAPHPEGAGLRRAILDALHRAGVEGSELAFVNAHGTGTPDNDRVEGRVFADLLPGIPFFSTKGHTGHTLGAAGAIEAAFTLASLEAGWVPASAGFQTPDPEIGSQPTGRVQTVTGRAALSTSLAFGGNNAAVVFGVAP